ncbi:MAG: RNA-binding protein [Ruminococcaceae bacterium]|nr:RNA-binding protein [Oscillospiraceae bacterium]
MDDLLGQFFVSLAGRDKSMICTVVGTTEDEGYVLIADGKLRKVESPKKKKLKHLKPIDCEKLSQEKLTNRFIREAINEYKENNEAV